MRSFQITVTPREGDKQTYKGLFADSAMATMDALEKFGADVKIDAVDLSRVDDTTAELIKLASYRHLIRCAIVLVDQPGRSEVAGESRANIAHRLQVMLAASWPDEIAVQGEDLL